MGSPADAFTKNSFIDKCMKVIPEDPLTQTHYMYLLTAIVFFGLLGYAASSWWVFAHTLKLTTFFSSLFMTAIAIMSVFGLKQTRTAYLATKMAYGFRPKNVAPVPDKIESVEEMQGMFK